MNVLPTLPELLIVGFIALVLLVPFWRIFAKAGYHGGLSLLMVVPGLNLLMLYFLAFAQWPSRPTTGRE